MPAFVPLSRGAQVEIRFETDLGINENTLWFRHRTSAVDATNLQELADGVQAWYAMSILPLLSHELSGIQVRATRWLVASDIEALSASSIGSGGSASNAHSANVSVLVRFVGSAPPNRFYNWNFVPGIPLDVVTLNTVDETFLSALIDGYVALIDAAPLFGPFPSWDWVVTSRIDAGSPRTTQQFRTVAFVQSPSPYTSPRRMRLRVNPP